MPISLFETAHGSILQQKKIKKHFLNNDDITKVLALVFMSKTFNVCVLCLTATPF